MKINHILIALLISQLTIYFLRNLSTQKNGSSRTVASVSDQSLTLDPQRGGNGLKAWLNQHKVDLNQPDSTLGVSASELNQALKRTELDQELSANLEAAVALMKVSRVTLAEGPRDPEEIDPQAAKLPTYIAFNKEGDQWLIESAQGYPAGNEKVRSLVKNLMGASLGTVIATRAAHHTKLRVSDLRHDRKITFILNGETQTWYVGAGKGGSVHLREANQERVYRVKELTIWQDMSLDLKRYVDGSYFKLNDATSAIVLGPGDRKLVVKKENESWFVEGLSEVDVDHSKAKTFVATASDVMLKQVTHRLSQQELTTLEGVEEARPFGFDHLVKITSKNGKEEASFELAQKGELFYVWKPKSAFIVEVDAYKVRTLLTQNVDDFLTLDAIEIRNKANQEEAVPTETIAPPPVAPPPVEPPPVAPSPVTPSPVTPSPVAPPVAPTPSPSVHPQP